MTNKYNYQEYLSDFEWQQSADKEKERANYRCDIFGNLDGNLLVHHRSYKRLGNEPPSDLVVLCPGCHAIVHSQPSPTPIAFVSDIHECQTCGGSGYCYSSHGYGYTDENCAICYGTGKCQICSGKGKIKELGYEY